MNAGYWKQRIKRIPDDEPVFVLRAQDSLAADAIDFWADRAEDEGVHSGKVAGARRDAREFRAFPADRKRLPD